MDCGGPVLPRLAAATGPQTAFWTSRVRFIRFVDGDLPKAQVRAQVHSQRRRRFIADACYFVPVVIAYTPFEHVNCGASGPVPSMRVQQSAGTFDSCLRLFKSHFFTLLFRVRRQRLQVTRDHRFNVRLR